MEVEVEQSLTPHPTLVQSPLTTLGQETRWAYSTMITHMGPETHTGHWVVEKSLRSIILDCQDAITTMIYFQSLHLTKPHVYNLPEQVRLLSFNADATDRI